MAWQGLIRSHRTTSRTVAAALIATAALMNSPAQATEIEPAPIKGPTLDALTPEDAAEIIEVVEAMPIEILDQELQPGTLTRLELRTSESFSGSSVTTPVAVIHGRWPGSRLCVVAGVHGDEVNGVDVVRRMLRSIDPKELRGTVVAVPIANLSAFRRGSRYLPDRRDLNRFFPGRAFGSSASRIAHGIFQNIVRDCDALIDLHTGSFHRTNIHQLRADLSDPETARLSHEFGAAIVVNSSGRVGTLRRSATEVGIPAITVEAGESARFDALHAAEALDGILRLLAARKMLLYDDPRPTVETTAYLRTRWLRADHGGILVSQIRLGDEIYAGQNVGTISDPLSDRVTMITSPLAGRVIGAAIDQVVMPGFAAFHVGYDARPFNGVIGEISVQPEVSAEEGSEGVDLEERPE